MKPAERISAKRHNRITEARLAIKRAERHMVLYPYQSSALLLIRDMKLALIDLLDEVD